MQTRDFLDQVDLTFYVQTPTRNVDREFLIFAGFRYRVEAELFQNVQDLIRGEISAENALHLRNSQCDRRLVKAACDYVAGGPNQFAASGREDQLGNAIARKHGRFEIRASLKSM